MRSKICLSQNLYPLLHRAGSELTDYTSQIKLIWNAHSKKAPNILQLPETSSTGDRLDPVWMTLPKTSIRLGPWALGTNCYVWLIHSYSVYLIKSCWVLSSLAKMLQAMRVWNSSTRCKTPLITVGLLCNTSDAHLAGDIFPRGKPTKPHQILMSCVHYVHGKLASAKQNLISSIHFVAE